MMRVRTREIADKCWVSSETAPQSVLPDMERQTNVSGGRLSGGNARHTLVISSEASLGRELIKHPAITLLMQAE